MKSNGWHYGTAKEIEKTYNRTGKCNKCGLCCQFVMFNCPQDPEERKYFSNFGFEFVTIDGTKSMILKKRCKNLTKDNKCKIFNSDKLPIPCRQFPFKTDGVYKMVSKKCSFKFPKEKKEIKMQF